MAGQFATGKLNQQVMAARLNPRHQSSIRTKIQASAILNKMQAHVLETCSCYAAVEKDKEPRYCSVSAPAGVKLSSYLLSQAIGAPPLEIKGNVDIGGRGASQIGDIGHEA